MSRTSASILAIFLSFFVIVQIGSASEVKVFYKDFPKKLSEWGLVSRVNDELVFAPRVLPYAINSTLFSDYALKFRTVWMPEHQSAEYDSKEAFRFPVGTIISKTFYYPADGKLVEGPEPIPVLNGKENVAFRLEGQRLIETRLLVNTPEGWKGLAYLWNAEQSEAFFAFTGKVIPMHLEAKEIRYRVPNVNQCTDCHGQFRDREKYTTPIGLKARQINREFPYPGGVENQLVHWAREGYLRSVPSDLSEVEKGVVWNGPGPASIEQRARTYLDVNCAHCHSPSGIARPSGLFLRLTDGKQSLKIGAPAVAAGPGAGNRRADIDPGHPENSILIYRMETERAEAKMPPVGRSVPHREALEVLEKWIGEMRE